MKEETRKAYRLFASILDYPGSRLKESAGECVDILTGLNDKAASLLARFEAFTVETPLNEMEEIYTRTFDLQPVCYPYAGYQLFGESYKRGAFLVALKEKYRVHGFSVEGELPDHIPVILRFLSILKNRGEEHVLLEDCLAPVLDKMDDGFEEGNNPYSGVVRSLKCFLEGVMHDACEHNETNQPERG